MARGEEDSLAVRREIAAGRASAAGADALGTAAGQRLGVNLIERVIERLSLIDDLLAVGREIAFARFDEAAGDLADVGKEFAFDGFLGGEQSRKRNEREG